MKLRFCHLDGFGMKYLSTTSRSSRFSVQCLLLLIAALSCAVCGCKDGPLYAMKTVNPYFTMNEWKHDEELGVTDHERLKQMTKLSEQIGTMSAERQEFWAGHLKRIMENDPSPEMRRLSVVAAGKLKNPTAVELIERGLDDESRKVRLFACETLGRRPGDQSAQLLASTAGTETDEDVRQAAWLPPTASHSLRLSRMQENQSQRRRRHPLYPAGLAQRRGPNAVKLAAELVRKTWHGPVVQRSGQRHALISPQTLRVLRLPLQIGAIHTFPAELGEDGRLDPIKLLETPGKRDETAFPMRREIQQVSPDAIPRYGDTCGKRFIGGQPYVRSCRLNTLQSRHF